MARLTRSSWIKIVLIILLCLVVCGGLLSCSIGCSTAARHASSIAGMMRESVNFTERGDFSVPAQEVRSLQINWLAGEVEISVFDDEEEDEALLVTAVEEIDGLNRNNYRMTWQLNDGLLQISYGTRGLGISGCSYADSKRLKISLPRSIAQSLDSIALSAASGTYIFGPIGCKTLDINLASGRVSGKDLVAQNLNLDVASGNIDMSGNFPGIIDLKLASGNIGLTCNNLCPRQTWLDVASGQLLLTIPEKSGITASISKLSGSFNCNIPGSWNQSGSSFTSGDGKCSMDVRMASGNVTVNGS